MKALLGKGLELITLRDSKPIDEEVQSFLLILSKIQPIRPLHETLMSMTLEEFAEKAKYCEPFRSTILEKMLPSDFPRNDVARITVFQALSKFLSKDPLRGEDLFLFTRVMRSFPNDPLFMCVVEILLASANDGFEWTDESARMLCDLFRGDEAMNLPGAMKCLYGFVDRTMMSENHDVWKCVVGLIMSLAEKRRIAGFETEFVNRLVHLKELVSRGDVDALLLVKYWGRYVDRSYFAAIAIGYMDSVAPEYVDEEEKMVKMHDIPGVFTGRKPADGVEMYITKDELIGGRNKEILCRGLGGLGKRLPVYVGTGNDFLCKFAVGLADEYQKVLASVFQEALLENANRRRRVLCSLLRCVETAEDPGLLDWTSAIIMDKELLDPLRTVYGPNSIDDTMNEYRASIAAVLVRRNAETIAGVIDRFKDAPFLMAEIVARMMIEPSFDCGKLTRCETVRAMSNVFVMLQMVDSDFAPRSVIFKVFVEMLRKKCRINGLLALSDSQFANAFARFLYETRTMDAALHAIGAFFTSVYENERDIPSGSVDVTYHVISFLRSFMMVIPEKRTSILEFIADVVTVCPMFGTSFSVFIDTFLDALEAEPGSIILGYLMTVLGALGVEVKPSARCLRVMSRCISTSDYLSVLNLCAESGSVPAASFFLIRKPVFLPLLFVAVNGDEVQTGKLLLLLHELAVRSRYNAGMLHTGGVDALLLDVLIKGPLIKYYGIDLDVRASVSSALGIVEIIVGVVSDSSIARKFIKAVDATRDKCVTSCLNRIVGKANAWFSNVFQIGNLPSFASCRTLTGEDFRHGFSIVFWMNTDQSILSGMTAVIHIVIISDKQDNWVSISMIGTDLYTLRGTKSSLSLVLLTRKVPSFVWHRFAIQIVKDSDTGCSIRTFIDDETPVQGSLLELKFANGPLTVSFGGYDFMRRRKRLVGVACALISDIYLFKRVINDSELNHIANGKGVPDDYVCALDGGKFGHTRNVVMSAHVKPNATFLSAMASETNARKLINSYFETKDANILHVSSCVLSKSMDVHLPSEVASRLFDETKNFELYVMMFELARYVEDINTRTIWLEDVLVNFAIWGNTDDAIFDHWNTTLISAFSSVFATKSYFRYFLTNMKSLSPAMLKMLKCAGYLAFEPVDCRALMTALNSSNSDTHHVLAYLEVVRDLASTMSKYCPANVMLPFIGNDNIDIAILAVQAFARMCDTEFYVSIGQVLEKITKSEEVVRRLESCYSDFPELFSLSCAICLENHELSVISIPTVMPYHELWYLYPVRMSVACDGLKTAICGLLGATVMKGANIYDVMYLMMVVGDHLGAVEMVDFMLGSKLDISRDTAMGMVALLLFRVVPSDTVNRFHIVQEQGVHPSMSIEQLDDMSLRNAIVNGMVIFHTDIVRSTGRLVCHDLCEKVCISVEQLDFLEPSASKSTNSIIHGMSKSDGEEPTMLEVLRATKMLISREERKTIDLVMPMFTALDKLTLMLQVRFIEWQAKEVTSMAKITYRPVHEELEAHTVNDIGRVNGSMHVKRFVTVCRDDVLVGYCPCNFVREKEQSAVPRLLSVCSDKLAGEIYIVTSRGKQPIKIMERPSKITRRHTMCVQFIRTNENVLIDMDNIDRVVLINDTSFALTLKGGSQYVFEYVSCKADNTGVSRKDATEMASFARRPIVAIEQKDKDNVLRSNAILWSQHKLTMFEYISIINEINGHVYVNSNRYPKFPSLGYLKDDDTDGLCTTPEMFYLGDRETPIDTVYENRKVLEAVEDIGKWVELAFGKMDFEHPSRKKSVSEKDWMSLVHLLGSGENEKLIFCTEVIIEKRNFSLCCIDDTNIMRFFAINIKEGKATASILKTRKLRQSIGKQSIYAVADGIIVSDDVSVAKHTEIASVEYFGVEGCLWFSDEICQLSDTELCRYKVNTEKHIVFEKFAALPDRICCIASSSRFHVTVAGCIDGTLRIRSSATGLKCATVSLDNELPLDIIITKSWGFIIAKTPMHIFVFDVNGRLAARIDNTSEIRHWNSFVNADGFDFVVYVADCDIFCFEAMKPDNMTRIGGHSDGRNVVNVSTYHHNNCTFIVTIYENGKTIITLV